MGGAERVSRARRNGVAAAPAATADVTVQLTMWYTLLAYHPMINMLLLSLAKPSHPHLAAISHIPTQPNGHLITPSSALTLADLLGGLWCILLSVIINPGHPSAVIPSLPPTIRAPLTPATLLTCWVHLQTASIKLSATAVLPPVHPPPLPCPKKQEARVHPC